MNVRAMQKGFQQQVNAMDIPIESEDIIYYLNRGQEQFVDDQYVFLRGKYTDNGSLEIYQTSQKAIENLRTLIETSVIGNANIIQAVNFKNAKTFSLPTDFYYYVRSQTQLADAGDWVNNKLVEQENIQKFIKTKYNSPVFRDFLILMEGTEVFVFYDDQSGADVYDVAFTYLKTPDELTLDDTPGSGETNESQLPKHTHQDIIDLSVRLMLIDRGNIKPDEED